MVLSQIRQLRSSNRRVHRVDSPLITSWHDLIYYHDFSFDLFGTPLPSGVWFYFIIFFYFLYIFISIFLLFTNFFFSFSFLYIYSYYYTGLYDSLVKLDMSVPEVWEGHQYPLGIWPEFSFFGGKERGMKRICLMPTPFLFFFSIVYYYLFILSLFSFFFFFFSFLNLFFFSDFRAMRARLLFLHIYKDIYPILTRLLCFSYDLCWMTMERRYTTTLPKPKNSKKRGQIYGTQWLSSLLLDDWTFYDPFQI